MDIPTLKAVPREGTGSRASRRSRINGFTPISVYGHGKPNLALRIEARELARALETTAQLFMLDIEGGQESCLVKEVQYDTFGQEVLHVDFARMDLAAEVHVEVALELFGNAAGVTAGGTLLVAHNTLKVACRADSIPSTLRVDITGVGIGESLHAGDITLPSGVKLDASVDPTAAMLQVVAPKRGAAAEALAAAQAAEEGGEGAEGGDEAPKADG